MTIADAPRESEPTPVGPSKDQPSPDEKLEGQIEQLDQQIKQLDSHASSDDVAAKRDELVQRLAEMQDELLWRRGRRRLGRTSNEWARSLGREGMRAAATLAICSLVLLSGAVIVALTWTRTDVVSKEVPVGAALLGGWAALILIALGSGALLNPLLSSKQIGMVAGVSLLGAGVGAVLLWQFVWTVRLPAVWVMFIVAVAISGYLLSAQVDKPWVRGFSLCGLVILGLLLITIGRNERVNMAAQAAETDFLQLSQIREEAGGASDAADALVAELCRLGEVDACGEIPEVEAGARLDACLPGWTYQAFDEWTQAASIDRRVAATSALARCELRAFDPGALVEGGDTEQGEGGSGSDPPVAEQPEEELVDNDSDEEASTEEAAQQAEVDALEQQAAAEARAQASADARVAVAEAISVQRSEANLVETFAAGADGILSSLSGPNEFAEFRFSAATWLVLLAFTLLWYRRLEIRAGSHGLGPVEVVYEEVASPPSKEGDSESSNGGGSGPIHTGHAVFKQAVVQNVPEPGAVPGAQALAPVGDLIASTDAPNKWVATGFVDAIRTILAWRGGYTVMFSAYEESAQIRGSNESTYVVFVRVRDTQNGTQMASMRFESEYLAEAAQMAGYWVAGWIISKSRYVPEWAVWSEREAHAFYNLQWRQGDDLPLQAHGFVDPNRIQAPANALVLAQRAYAYQISPRERKDPDSKGPYVLNALEDFARAAYHQPRYPVARYRRAVALSSLMDEGVNLDASFLPRGSGEGTDSPSKNRLLHLFRDLLGYDEDAAQLNEWITQAVEPDERKFPVEMRRAMLEMAYAWLVEAQRSVKTGFLAQLRPSERRFWHEFNRTGTRRDWTMLVRVSQQIVKVRLKRALEPDADESAERQNPPYGVAVEPMPQEIIDRALEPDSHWQISYNIGCYHSLMAGASTEPTTRRHHREEAFDWLERCLDRPFSGQLVREWIDRDPDLAAVREPYERPGVDDHPGSDDRVTWIRWRLRVPSMPVLIRLGDRSAAVKHMQVRLNLLDASDPELEEDGEFGDKTLQVVKDFQFEHELRVTGNPDLTMLALLATLVEEQNYRNGDRRSTTDEPAETGAAR